MDRKVTSAAEKSMPFCIGSDACNGLSKLIEECGEVIQVCGKIIALGGMGRHWDGSDLKKRLEDEIGDMAAAAEFFTANNHLDEDRIRERFFEKLETFHTWNEEQRKPNDGSGSGDAGDPAQGDAVREGGGEPERSGG